MIRLIAMCVWGLYWLLMSFIVEHGLGSLLLEIVKKHGPGRKAAWLTALVCCTALLWFPIFLVGLYVIWTHIPLSVIM